MSEQQFLARWAQVTQEVTALLDLALDVEPPGTSTHAWDVRRDALGVPATPDDARLASVQRLAQRRGADAQEVERALEVVHARAAAALGPLTQTLTAQQATTLREALAHLVEQAARHYRERATAPKPKRGMFGAAKKLAAQHQYGAHTKAHGYVLTCEACGGPRLSEALTCAFCGGAL